MHATTRPNLLIAAAILALVLPSAARAQSGGNFSRAADSPLHYTLAPEHPSRSCASLRDALPADTTATSASIVPAHGEVPEHCRVRGLIAPAIRFEVNLPTDWSRRIYMFGNGGYAGEDLDAPARRDLSDGALRRGFATTQTNTGHDARRQPLGTFMGDDAKLVDYAFRAVHRTLDTAKRLAAVYYGRPAAFSYWDGCSTGGRQGLMSAQRFPDDFDGILDGAPVLNFVDTMIVYVWNAKALAGTGLTVDKAKTIARAAYTRCDAEDGLADGLIADPRRCDFDVERDVPQCPAGQDGADCLTPAQAEAVSKIYAGITRPDGSHYFFGYPKGAEVVGAASDGSDRQVSGWERWFIGVNGEPSQQTLYMSSFMRYGAFGREETDFDPARFDFGRDPARMDEIRALLNANDPDLSGFRRHGGKLLMYHGWADTALTPFMSIDYYERATKINGPDTPDFFRLFMIPGMAHCRGGVATDRFDGISALVNWVENGAAPDRITAERMLDGKLVRSRPLCPYPQSAVYSGTGSIDEAGNFVCKDPR